MRFEKEITLKNGKPCLLRNGVHSDGPGALEVFLRTHEETDYLLTYPDETTMTAEEEASFLQEQTDSDGAIEILALVDGKIVATGGIEAVGGQWKRRHRAEFGVAVLRDYWGLGIGRALMEACIQCARQAGYAQLELSVVAENEAALALYRQVGFVEYGRDPMGFRTRPQGYQTLVYMRLAL